MLFREMNLIYPGAGWFFRSRGFERHRNTNPNRGRGFRKRRKPLSEVHLDTS